MTTAELHPLLRRDIEKLKLIDAAVLLVVSAAPLVLPDAVIRWVGLGETSVVGLRAVALACLVLGAIAAGTLRHDVPRTVATAFAVARLALALFLATAPLAFGLAVTARGWFAIGALFFFLATSSAAWFFVRDRITAPALRGPAYPDGPVAPPADADISDR